MAGAGGQRAAMWRRSRCWRRCICTAWRRGRQRRCGGADAGAPSMFGPPAAARCKPDFASVRRIGRAGRPRTAPATRQALLAYIMTSGPDDSCATWTAAQCAVSAVGARRELSAGASRLRAGAAAAMPSRAGRITTLPAVDSWSALRPPGLSTARVSARRALRCRAAASSSNLARAALLFKRVGEEGACARRRRATGWRCCAGDRHRA